jgi:hypothetical protein
VGLPRVSALGQATHLARKWEWGWGMGHKWEFIGSASSRPRIIASEISILAICRSDLHDAVPTYRPVPTYGHFPLRPFPLTATCHLAARTGWQAAGSRSGGYWTGLGGTRGYSLTHRMVWRRAG